ncbi:MAG: hypothetical protein Q8S13_09935 [Dehalococcoidia bacterium]|nr:hypothetical protein [Dehalococcoidia bacterium]
MSDLTYRWGVRVPPQPGGCGLCRAVTEAQLFLVAGSTILNTFHFCQMCFEQVRAMRIDPASPDVLLAEKDAATGTYRWTGAIAARGGSEG